MVAENKLGKKKKKPQPLKLHADSLSISFQQPAQTQTQHQASAPYPTTLAPTLAPPLFPRHPGISTLKDCRSEGSLTAENSACRWTSQDIRSRCRRRLITFDMLPDDVLLEISDFYMGDRPLGEQRTMEWIKLAHVCRQWRSVVFQSPRRLNLRLVCTAETPARDTIDMWPPLPLIIHDFNVVSNVEPSSVDNIIAALEHNDRVCQIELKWLTTSQLKCVTDSAAMQEPFPELTELYLDVDNGAGPILAESFLGGTAPRLRSLELWQVSFPALPKLLSSATHLVHLDLFKISRSGYIPPEVMAASLSALTSLESLYLQFQYPRPRLALEAPPPLTRSILSRLTQITFKGSSEYLEVILARIDAPLLHKLYITLFNQIIFNTPQLSQFISRGPMKAWEKGLIGFSSEAIHIQTPNNPVLSVEILSSVSEWQLTSLQQVCMSFLPRVSALEDLYIQEDQHRRPHWQDDVENTQWLDLLRPFVLMKNFYLSKEFVPRIAPALQEVVGGRTMEVLPTLENIFLEGFQPLEPLQEGIEKFVAARQLTDLPVTVSRWDRDL